MSTDPDIHDTGPADSYAADVPRDEGALRAAHGDMPGSRKPYRLSGPVRLIPSGLTMLLILASLGWVVHKAAFSTPDPTSRLKPLTQEELKDPFRSTSAETYPVGAAGIVVPPARAVGRYSAAEVARALATTRDLLILSRLDERVLERRDVAPLAAAVAPEQRKQFAPGKDVSAYASLLAPGERLLAPPRVKGSMVPTVDVDGDLTVNTDFVFVYALRPRDDVYFRPDTHTIVRAKVAFFFLWGEGWRPESRGSWFGAADTHWSNFDCDFFAKGLLAPPRTSSTGHSEEPDDTDYYELDQPVPRTQTCPGDDSSAGPSASAGPHG